MVAIGIAAATFAFSIELPAFPLHDFRVQVTGEHLAGARHTRWAAIAMNV